MSFDKTRSDAEWREILKQQDGQYELGYHSKVSWFLFKDERNEKSRFTLVNGRIQPSFYQMQRSGTGPNRHYELNLDWSKQQLPL